MGNRWKRPEEQTSGSKVQITKDGKGRVSLPKFVNRDNCTFKYKPLSQTLSLEECRREMKTIPYVNGVESIMYDIMCSRLALPHLFNVVSGFMVDPRYVHWQALKGLLRYVKGTVVGTIGSRTGVNGA
ncbi:uncharacterized protein [Phaseolus vulgaris]|uniref:uncharacterized protein n=1 Tax=Phaseolus vulgaris TaxID=3885 RepID=UPI0035CCA5F2